MARRVSKKFKIRNYYKQILSAVVGVVICFSSQFIETVSVQEATKQELNRISETSSVATSDLIIQNHSALSNAVLILGLCIVILAVISAIIKFCKEEIK